MRGVFGRPLSGLIRGIVRLAVRVAPPIDRLRWREIWRGELDEHRHRIAEVGGSRTRLELLRHALGILSHACWLRTRRWTPDALLQDLKYGFRILLRSPRVAAITVLVLGLGIGAATSIFTLVNGFLIRPVSGIEESSRLVSIWRTRHGSGHDNWSHPDFRYLAGSDALVGAVAYADRGVWLERGVVADRVPVQIVSGDFFQVLGVRPVAGRAFTPSTVTEDAAVAVIGHGMWRDRFGADPEVVGESLALNGRRVTIVGVAPEDFRGLDRTSDPRLWVPVELHDRLFRTDSLRSAKSRYMNWLFVVGRLRERVSVQEARAALALRLRQLRGVRELPDGTGVQVTATSGLEPGESAEVATVFGLLMALVGLLLTIACADVATLLLARTRSRTLEFGVRVALGATRGRLLRQLLAEVGMVALLAVLLGLALSRWTTGVLARLLETIYGMPFSVDLSPDVRVLGFAAAVALGSVLSATLLPGLRSIRRDAARLLQRGHGRGSGPARRLADALVVVPLALSIVVLIVAGLFFRSLHEVTRIEPGFDAERIVAVSLWTGSGSPDEVAPAGEAVELRRSASRMAGLPGIESVALGRRVPIADPGSRRAVALPGGEFRQVDYQAVGPGYFRTLGIPLLQGVDFGDGAVGADDRGPGADDGVAPAVVNRTLARRLWPDRDAVGMRVVVGDREAEVVGVVADSRLRGLREPVRAQLYLPIVEDPEAGVTIFVRSTGDTASLVRDLRLELESTLPERFRIIRIATVSGLIEAGFAADVLMARLVGLLGVVALTLAATGVYGVVSYLVSERTFEIAVRRALGATGRRVVVRTAGRAVGLGAVGAVLGAGAARALTPLLAHRFYGVGPADALTYAGAIVFLMSVATVAAVVPAFRAASIDPRAALQAE